MEKFTEMKEGKLATYRVARFLLNNQLRATRTERGVSQSGSLTLVDAKPQFRLSVESQRDSKLFRPR
jgi:hypothetical protein